MYVLFVWEKAHVSAIVEQHANAVVRQLVAKAVLVGVVHPLGDPEKCAAHFLLGHRLR